MKQIAEILKGNPYPGRGILLGKSMDGKHFVTAYFIMGRSENSRNRVFEKEAETLMIYPADIEKVEDPSLIIYAPLRIYKKNVIVTNGDQTDTIYQYLEQGKTFEEALKTRSFEPDAPNWTPRISGWIHLENGREYTLSILKSMDAIGKNCARYFYHYEAINGRGHLIHTYETDGNPLPSFTGEPREVVIENDIEKMADSIWNSLYLENKISLYVEYTECKTGKKQEVLINRFQRKI